MKIGVDIGGSHISIGVIDKFGKIVEKIDKDIVVRGNMEEYLINYIGENIGKLKQSYDITFVGIGVPGNPKGKAVKKMPNLGIDFLDFKELENIHNVKVNLVNDGVAAALAEKEYGSLQNYKDCVFLGIGTGIGAAAFLNNKLLKANRNSGFELAHIIIEKDGKQCNCGKKGCFETYCSIKRFKDNIEKVLKEISDRYNTITPKQMPDAIKENINNPKIKTIVDQFIEDFIVGTSNVIDIFEPEAICFGGSFVYFKDVLFYDFVEKMNERKYIYNRDSMPKFVLAELQNDAGIIGAALSDMI